MPRRCVENTDAFDIGYHIYKRAGVTTRLRLCYTRLYRAAPWRAFHILDAELDLCYPFLERGGPLTRCLQCYSVHTTRCLAGTLRSENKWKTDCA